MSKLNKETDILTAIQKISDLLNEYSPKAQGGILSGVLKRIGMGGTLYGYLPRDKGPSTVRRPPGECPWPDTDKGEDK